jgi:DNA-binding NarL/FixJ family response regulator
LTCYNDGVGRSSEAIAVGQTKPPPIVGAAAEAAVRARGQALRLKRVFDRSHVPMVMLDDRRHHVDANRPARLAFRLSLAQLLRLTSDDVVPRDELPILDEGTGRANALTSRQREILQLAAEGLSAPGIAEELVLSRSTVGTHFENIYERLGTGDRAAAVAIGMRLGLID